MATSGTPSSPDITTSVSSSVPSKFANAISMEDLKIVSVKYGDYSNISLPELPLGIWYQATDTSAIEHLTNYTLSDKIDTGEFNNRLSALQEKQDINFDRIVKIASEFLAKAVIKIGDYSLSEIAKRNCVTPSEFISKMYMADVITMIFGCRLAVVSANAGFSDDLKEDQIPRTPFSYAINTDCGCKAANTIKYDPRETNDYSLREVEIKLASLRGSKPIFEVPLSKGFENGGDRITKFYMEPLKWYQLANVASSKEKDNAYILKMLMAMVVGVPESSVYGLSKNNHPFCKELFDSMSSIDINVLKTALGKLQFGPEAAMQINCYHCDKMVAHQIPWFAMANFIYSSDELIEV